MDDCDSATHRRGEASRVLWPAGLILPVMLFNVDVAGVNGRADKLVGQAGSAVIREAEREKAAVADALGRSDDDPRDERGVAHEKGLCNEKVGQAFQPDQGGPTSIIAGNPRQPGKADLRLRCKATKKRSVTSMMNGSEGPPNMRLPPSSGWKTSPSQLILPWATPLSSSQALTLMCWKKFPRRVRRCCSG